MASKFGPNVNDIYLEQIEAARAELRTIITTQNCAPIMLRLAFQDACSYDAKKKRGGANGTIRMELSSPQNKGIQVAVDLCEQVKAKNPKITYADLYQLAGVIAVEAIGGPEIRYSAGRRDALEEELQDISKDVPNLAGDAKHLRNVYHKMGFSDRDIVALSGIHVLGGADHTKQSLKFDNSYYVELLKEETTELAKLPADNALLEDRAFSKYVQLYAKDKKKLIEDYTKAHEKMSELGVNRPLTFDQNGPNCGVFLLLCSVSLMGCS